MLSSPVVLLVDDQPDNLRVLSAVLDEGYQIRAVTSGEAALRAASHAPAPDLVILDVMMPVMDGFETYRRLRELPQMADVPVIFATALNDEASEEAGLQLGAADFISKPLRPRVVKARVKAQLEAYMARRWQADRAGELQREVQRRLRDFYLVQDVALRALASLAETRDNETGNHILRTQAYVAALGRQLSSHPRFAEALAADSLRFIVKAAPLHDIGKVGIPDHILLKPGKLTEEEFVVMRTHAALGADAIERALRDAEPGPDCDSSQSLHFEFLEAARDIAGFHHERWDGSGYPQGLAGDAIPASARLMALADVYDALISRRVYIGSLCAR
ncbi:two-component system response regulator [Chitinimonas sp.]|uniref:response regulator n=1 Tax=Chitinimonas sp. TaxID=1934313 RepID=UPI0035B1E3E7